MGVRTHSVIVQAKHVIKENPLERKQVYKASKTSVPKGCLPVYVGDVDKKRFVVPMTNLNHPKFQKLHERSAEEYDFSHPTGGLTIPCKEEDFINLVSQLKAA